MGKEKTMSSQPLMPTSLQDREVAQPPTQDKARQKMPFHQPQIGPLRHILQETGQGGKSSQYDSYNDNRS